MFYFIYVLQFNNTKEFYKGYTKNLKLRLEQHQKGLLTVQKTKACSGWSILKVV